MTKVQLLPDEKIEAKACKKEMKAEKAKKVAKSMMDLE